MPSPFYHEPPTATMLDLCRVLGYAPPEDRWSPGGVFLGILADRFDDLNDEIASQPPLPSRKALSRKIAYETTTGFHDASIWRVASDLHVWDKTEGDAQRLTVTLRRALTRDVEQLTFSYLTTFPLEP